MLLDLASPSLALYLMLDDSYEHAHELGGLLLGVGLDADQNLKSLIELVLYGVERLGEVCG